MRRLLLAFVAVAVGSAWQLAAGAPLAPGPVGSAPGNGHPVSLGTAQAARTSGDAALMPAEAGLPGWKRIENQRVFTRADLYGYIDGGAELFLELGFDQLTLQKYRNGSNDVAVEIYRMADGAAATGIYLMKCGKETHDPAFKERHTINRHQLMFARDRYYVTINNLSGADTMAPELVRFGSLVGSKLPTDRPPVELQRLPVAGLVAGSQRLIRGPFSLQALYTLGDGDILQLGGKLTAVAGNYRDAGGAYTLVAVAYPDAAAARKALANVQQNLDKYLKSVNSTPSRLVFKDYENKFGSLTLTGRQIEIRLHLTRQPQ
ncbi:MAG TPA: DUF6599 family protein [Vicinamibacterales bacterium]|jgi:hypothetical protein